MVKAKPIHPKPQNKSPRMTTTKRDKKKKEKKGGKNISTKTYRAIHEMMELGSCERCSSVFSILLSLHIKGYIDHFQQFQVQIGGKFQKLSSVKFHELFNILITCTNCGSLKGIIVHFTWNQLCHDTRAWSPLPRTRCGTNYANIVFTCVYLGDSSAVDDARIKSEKA